MVWQSLLMFEKTAALCLCQDLLWMDITLLNTYEQKSQLQVRNQAEGAIDCERTMMRIVSPKKSFEL